MTDLYIANVQVTGGRDGRAISDDGQLSVSMAMPGALGGSGQGTNPEQLFAAGFAGCFVASIKFVAHQKKLVPGEVTAKAQIALLGHEDGHFGLRATLDVTVPGLSGGDLEAVISEAKRICAYTNATRGNVETTYVVNGR